MAYMTRALNMMPAVSLLWQTSKVAPATIYAWRKHFGGLEPTDVKRLRQLEQENGRLKKLVADLTLDIDVLKEVSRKKW